MRELLSEREQRVRAELRALLTALDDAVKAMGATAEDRQLLADAVRGLDELFLLVVVGEFNAGKSALLNELLGTRLLVEGVTPTTAEITLVRHGSVEAERRRGDGLIERQIPADVLRDLAVVDTPGTNAIIRRHEELTREFIPRADLVLLVTSADRPFSESERELLERIRAWGKKIVVIVNKVDLLADRPAIEQVRSFVADGLRASLGFEPPLFIVSVRLARLAAEAVDPTAARALLAQSHLADLRTYVFDTLDELERLRLKLATPIGVAQHALTRFSRIAADQTAALQTDLELVDNVEAQVDLHRREIEHALAPRLAQIENVIHELNDRGERFLDDRVRLGRIFDLLNPDRTRAAFEEEVVANTSAELDRLVDEIVDWLVDSEARLWRQVSALVRSRQRELVAPGEVEPDFLRERRKVFDAVSERTQTALRTFDRERQGHLLGNTMRDAVAQTALAEIGAVSIGAAIAILFGTVAADVTGLLAATLAAGLGLYILPARKRRAIAAFQARTQDLRERLVGTLRTQLEREAVDSAARVREALQPYTLYVRAEGERLERQRQTLAGLRERLTAVHGEIETLGGTPAALETRASGA